MLTGTKPVESSRFKRLTFSVPKCCDKRCASPPPMMIVSSTKEMSSSRGTLFLIRFCLYWLYFSSGSM